MNVANEYEGGGHAHQDAVEVFNPRGAGGLNSTLTWDPGAQARQAHAEGADAAVDALSASAEAHRANGDMTRLSETETWLALAREDQAAAAASIDYRDLAAMGPESVMTETSLCCGYPEAEAS